MKCVDCPHFKIVQEPLRSGSEIWDYGMARCKKHDLVVDFANHTKINRLECVEEQNVLLKSTKH